MLKCILGLTIANINRVRLCIRLINERFSVLKRTVFDICMYIIVATWYCVGIDDRKAIYERVSAMMLQ